MEQMQYEQPLNTQMDENQLNELEERFVCFEENIDSLYKEINMLSNEIKNKKVSDSPSREYNVT